MCVFPTPPNGSKRFARPPAAHSGETSWTFAKNYPHADAVTVASKRRVIVLNVGGNKYRLIIAVHFNTRTLFTLRLLTHAEYSKDHWKEEL